MRIISRYITFELLVYIAEAAVLFTFVFLLKSLYDLTDLFVAGSSTFFVTLQLLFSIMPTILIMTFPMAVLLASLLVYGRMSQDNEITALQASGYSVFQLLIPALVLGIVLTLLLYWWNNRIAPKGLRTFQMMAADVLRDSATAGIRPGSFNQLGNYIFNPSAVKGDQMLHLNIFEVNDGQISGVVSAPTASIVYSPKSNTLRVKLREGMLHQMPQPDRDVMIQFGEMEFSIALPELLKRVAKVTSSVKYLSNKTLTQLSENYLESYQKSPNKDLLEIQWFLKQVAKYDIEIARRSALPFACVLMTVVGSLLGMETRYGKRSSCYTMTIVMILGYHFFMSVGKAYAEEGMISPYLGMWLPNAVSLIVAVYLYIRTLRV